MTTYQELLERMKDAYLQHSGYSIEDVSDAEIRLQVVAGELFNLLCSLDWLRLQAFPQTACGTELDLHAEQRGLYRKPGEKAAGCLDFGRQQPLNYDVPIPKGTVCAAVGGETAEYETTEAGLLKAGETTVEVAAEAALAGKAYNAAAGYVNVLVTPPAGIETVTNTLAFSGGADREDDETLRQRLMRFFVEPPNGCNAAFYEKMATDIQGITTAMAVPRENGTGTVGLYIWGDGGPAPAELADTLQEQVETCREINVDVTVKDAAEKPVNIYIYLKPKAGCTFAEAAEAAEQAVQAFFQGKTIGSRAYKSEIGAAIMLTGPVENYLMAANTVDVPSEAGKIPVLGSFQAQEMT